MVKKASIVGTDDISSQNDKLLNFIGYGSLMLPCGFWA